MERTCDAVLETLADLAAERLPPEEARRAREHLGACPACRELYEAARWVYLSRPDAPEGFSRQVRDAVRTARARRAWWVPSWARVAAAVAVLALGLGWGIERRGGPGPEEAGAPEIAYGLEHDEMWIADDGIIAGAPTLDELSDEMLEALLSELGPNSAGGAA